MNRIGHRINTLENIANLILTEVSNVLTKQLMLTNIECVENVMPNCVGVGESNVQIPDCGKLFLNWKATIGEQYTRNISTQQSNLCT